MLFNLTHSIVFAKQIMLSSTSKDIALILNSTFVNDSVNCKLKIFNFGRISIEELHRNRFQIHSVVIHDNSVIVNERHS